MVALVRVVLRDQGAVILDAELECQMGMPIHEAFLDCMQAYLLKVEAEPGAFAFAIDSLKPSHIDGVAITCVCTPCVIYGHVIDASGIPAGVSS